MLSRFAKLFCLIIVSLLVLATLASLHPPTRAYIDPWTGELWGEGGVGKDWRLYPVHSKGHGSEHSGTAGGIEGGVIMSKLGNETAKAELGRATWKLLHTMTLRFPEQPTPDEREALSSFMYLASRLYPCGECASEFQELLKKFPPQTSSRRSASLWLCSVHNEVNIRLGKPVFDCAKLDETYDCGCGDPSISLTATTNHETAALEEKKSEAMDLEWDSAKDDVTGVELIKGGKR
ncbi:ERV/ALR sulfhydryl oxidase domain-containing protein [Pisolithus croceorrhizus]|nr:ERV/ALR sulfhydryl oxidase domain-containing protein [Pisolithus croceorrhizus]KAI6117822.1 ERV/ALR sulfhydryl oxidase domain-containing protein [Pisolithus croceorrhizus]KAI6163340.1 ERV/ALR sulfhydryl oxidase domain-containing protein [Pisolithus thermaeus]